MNEYIVINLMCDMYHFDFIKMKLKLDNLLLKCSLKFKRNDQIIYIIEKSYISENKQ